MCDCQKPEETIIEGTFRDGTTIILEIWHDQDPFFSPGDEDGSSIKQEGQDRFLSQNLKSRSCGYAWYPGDSLRREYREKFRQIRDKNPYKMRQEIEIEALAWWKNHIAGSLDKWQKYIDGEVYRGVLKHDGVVIDSSSGFFGYDHDESGLNDWAENGIKHYLKEQKKITAMMTC